MNKKGKRKFYARCLFPVLFVICGHIAGIRAWAGPKPAGSSGMVIPSVFVQKNIKAFKARLDALKKKYSSQCGSVSNALAPVDAAKIAMQLPRAKTLTYKLQYPDINWKGLFRYSGDNALYEAKTVLAGSLTVQAVAMGHDREYESSYSTSEQYPFTVAADEQTAMLMHIPHKVGLSISAKLFYPFEVCGYASSDGCCVKIGSKNGNHFCSKWQKGSYMKENTADPRLVPGIAEKITISGPGHFVENKAAMVFPTPGRSKIVFSLPAYKYPESVASTRSCKKEFSDKDKLSVPVAYKAAGKVKYTFYISSVRLEGLGFPGDTGHAAVLDDIPSYDFFFGGHAPSGKFSGQADLSNKSLSPGLYVSMDNGRGVEKKLVNYWDYPGSMTMTTIAPGPVTMSPDGNLGYTRGYGKTEVEWSLQGLFKVKKTLTANTVDVRIDPRLHDGIVASGSIYTVALVVKGPADMSGYTVRWSGAGGVKWASDVTAFSVKNGETVSENTFTAPDRGWHVSEGRISRKINNLFYKAEIVSARTGRAMLSYQSDMDINAGHPAVSSIKLAFFRGDKKIAAGAHADLFLPNVKRDKSALIIEPVVELAGVKDEFNISQFRGAYEIKASNPGILEFQSVGRDMPGGVRVYPATNYYGETEVVAKFGGPELDPGGKIETKTGDVVVSDPVKVSVNLMMLTRQKAVDGKTVYRLRIMGPAVMSKYNAVWARGFGTATTIFTNDGNAGWTATYKTGLKLSAVRIFDGSVLLAELDVTRGTCVPEVDIRLAPVHAPVTAIQTRPLPDLGMLGTITECKKQISNLSESQGLSMSRASINDYCKAKRLKDTAKILEQRKWQQGRNHAIRELASKGLKVVVLSDSMPVGAAIQGLSRQYWKSAECEWSVKGGAGLKLESKVSPVLMVSEDAGGCFNSVNGIKEHFNPDAVINVRLFIKPKPDRLPVFGNDSFIQGLGR